MGDYVRRSRGGGGDRFYYPPWRRQQKTQQQQQQQDHHHHNNHQLRLGQGGRVGSVAGSDEGASSSSSTKTGMETGLVSMPPEVENLTNLDRFIEHTRPRVPAQFLSKTSMREWRNYDGEFYPYFVLGDLWESFKEWSAYGAGVPLVLNGNESVVQYYVPYLSGIQLYIDPSKPVIGQRRPGEESDFDSSRETSSDGSEEIGADGGINNAQGTLKLQNHTGTDALAEGLSSLFLKNYPLTEMSGDEKELKNPPRLLIFEYFAHDPPYGREPLVDKITQLAAQFPDLKTYKSCDLTTDSWISVAWYPIYRIPMGPTLQSLDACFLTYHSLSTPLTRTKNKDLPDLHGSTSGSRIPDAGIPLRLLLRTFGLASYKFRISFWNFCGNHESQRSNRLKQNAENWLRDLKVVHPDYRFFQSHSSYWF